MFIDCQLVFTLINVSLAGGTCRQCESFVLWYSKNNKYILRFHTLRFSNKYMFDVALAIDLAFDKEK